MKLIYLGISFFLLFFYPIQSSLAQEMTIEQVVEKSLKGYNNKDIDLFMSVVDANITLNNFTDGSVLLKGEAACRKFYNALFVASPSLNSIILTRTIFDNKVIDHERITGRNGSK